MDMDFSAFGIFCENPVVGGLSGKRRCYGGGGVDDIVVNAMLLLPILRMPSTTCTVSPA